MKKLFAMLLALCMMCGVVSAGAEAMSEEQRETITFGRASIELEGNTDVKQQSDEDNCILDITLDQCDMEFLFFDYESADTEIDDMTNGDIQVDNCFATCYLYFGNAQTAINICNMSQRIDIGMPGGDDVLYFHGNGVVMLSYYYPNMGFLMFAESNDSDLTDDEVLEICKDVARSFRVDGMTVEEMDAYKEQAMAAKAEASRIAAEEAAAKAAAQKYVVITNSSANIRSGADASAAKITTAVKGDTFPLIGEDGNWYIIDVNGQTGYVTKVLSAIKD